jgi:YHS domain-containing protein
MVGVARRAAAGGASMRGVRRRAETSGRAKPRSQRAAYRCDRSEAEAFVNPVCGIAVPIANPKHVEHYEGVSYFCRRLLDDFPPNPAKYAAIHHASLGRFQ